MSRTRILHCSIAAGAISFAAAAVFAGTPASLDVMQHHTTVHYTDLNLNRAQDVAELYSRIEMAVQQVCGPRTLTGSYTTAPGYERCARNAMAQAVGHVDSPALTALYREQMSGAEGRQLAIAEQ
ncbi:MAG TPA: UrcA family protein [Steroidobacteraceae bacterium]|nr:UrcA family protein [Steroidobacteraceae bacterium]